MMFKRFAPVLLLLVLTLPARAGLEWEVFADPGALAGIAVTDDAVWCAGRGGLVRVDAATDEATYITTAEGLPMLDLTDVVVDGDGDVWVATAAAGLLRYSPGRADPWLRYRAIPNFLIDDEMLCLATGPQGRIWYGTRGGFGVIEDNGPGQVWYDQHGLDAEEVECLAFSGDTLLVGTWGGLYTLAPEQALAFDDQAPAGRIDALFALGDRIWCLSEGAIEYRGLDETAWTLQPLPLPATVTALCAAGDGLAVALEASGGTDHIYRYDPAGDAWTALPALPAELFAAYSTQEVVTLTADAAGTIYYGGDYGGGMGTGLVRLAGDAWVQTSFADRPLGGEMNVMSLGPSGRLLAMSTVGGAALEGDAWTRYPSDTEFAGMPRFGLAAMEDSRGRTWFSRYNASSGALGWFSEATAQREIVLTGTVLILDMAEDAEGNCWFSDEGQGLHVLGADDSWNTLSADNSALPGDVVDEIDFLPDGRVVLLVRSHGLIVWDTNGTLLDDSDDIVMHTTSQSGQPYSIYDSGNLLDDVTTWYSMCTTADGEIWVGQSDGVVIVSPYFSGFQALARLRERSAYSDGLSSPVTLDVAAAPDGSVWVATENGLSHVDYSQYEEEGSTYWSWSVRNWTTERGLTLLDETLFGADLISPMPHYLVRQVEVAGDGGTIYIGTNFGVARATVTEDLPASPAMVEGAYVYPNPARLALGHGEMRLGGVEQSVAVMIYNLEGQLVRDCGLVEPDGVLWDLETRFGNRAASGVYLARLEYRGAVEVREIVLVH